MADHSVKKIDSSASPHGPDGQAYLVSGKGLSMRLWEEPAGDPHRGGTGERHTRPYETVGYVVSGRVRITVGEDVITCGPGDSYLVPDGAERQYDVLEALVAVEATHPPAEVHGRDE